MTPEQIEALGAVAERLGLFGGATIGGLIAVYGVFVVWPRGLAQKWKKDS